MLHLIRFENMKPMTKTVVGCIFYTIAMALSVSSNVLIKRTMVDFHLPAWESIAIRQTVIVMILVPFMIKERFIFFHKGAMVLNLVKNILYAVSIGLAHMAFLHVPINEGVSLQFLTPIFTSVLAIIFLREKISLSVSVALMLCLGGALYITPIAIGSGALKVAYILLFASILLKSVNGILNRVVVLKFKTSTLIFYMHITILLVSICFYNTFVYAPLKAIIILAIVGVIYLMEYILIYKAQKYCWVSILQPLEFSKIIYAIILSNLILGEVLSSRQIIGGTIILFGFLVMIFGEHLIKYLKNRK